MDYLSLANLLTGVALLASAFPPLIIITKVRIKRVRHLTFLLSTFLILHGFFHLLLYWGDSSLALGLFGPVSAFTIIAFAVYLYRTTLPIDSLKKGSMGAIPSAVAAAGLVVIPLNLSTDVTLVALLISFAIFALMVYRHPSIRSLYFQFAVFLGLWIVSEIVYTIEQAGLPNLFPYPLIGAWFHFASMAAIGIFVNYRMFGFRNHATGALGEIDEKLRSQRKL